MDHPASPFRRAPRQRRSKSLVDAILIAATRLLATTPLERLSTTHIAERAGVSVGSLYQYFADRDSVVLGLVERFTRELGDEVVARIERRDDHTLAGVLGAGIDAFVELHARERRMVATLLPLIPMFQRVPFVRRVHDRARGYVRRALEEHHQGELREGDMELMTFVASRAVEQVVLVATAERPELLDDPRFRGELTRLAARYLARD